MLCDGRMTDKEYKLKQRVFRLDVKKNLFTLRTVQLWSRLLREVVQCPSLDTFNWRATRSDLTTDPVLNNRL